MNQQHQSQTEVCLNDLLEMLDELHSAASDGKGAEFAEMTHQELMSYLREVIFTAQETLKEVQNHKKKQSPILRLVEKIEKVG
jgi:hypothetical protein